MFFKSIWNSKGNRGFWVASDTSMHAHAQLILEFRTEGSPGILSCRCSIATQEVWGGD